MANRKNTFLIKRSNTPGKIPTAGDLLLGELALNTADVILYASGTTANTILPIGWDRVARTGDTMTGPLYGPSISATTISATTFYGNGNITVTGTASISTVSATTYLNLPIVTGSFGITIDGAGSVITTGVKGYAVIPYNATITGYDIIGNTSGSCAVDIWKSTSVPTSANTITGSEIPSLTNQQLNSDNSLTTWTTGIFINDIIAFNVISASTVSRINLIVKVIKT